MSRLMAVESSSLAAPLIDRQILFKKRPGKAFGYEASSRAKRAMESIQVAVARLNDLAKQEWSDFTEAAIFTDPGSGYSIGTTAHGDRRRSLRNSRSA